MRVGGGDGRASDSRRRHACRFRRWPSPRSTIPAMLSGGTHVHSHATRRLRPAAQSSTNRSRTATPPTAPRLRSTPMRRHRRRCGRRPSSTSRSLTRTPTTAHRSPPPTATRQLAAPVGSVAADRRLRRAGRDTRAGGASDQADRGLAEGPAEVRRHRCGGRRRLLLDRRRRHRQRALHQAVADRGQRLPRSRQQPESLVYTVDGDTAHAGRRDVHRQRPTDRRPEPARTSPGR